MGALRDLALFAAWSLERSPRARRALGVTGAAIGALVILKAIREGRE